MPAPLRLDGDGRLSLPARVALALGGQPLEVVSHSTTHLLCAVPAAAGELVLAGCLGALEIADLLSFFNMFRKTGVLRVSPGNGDKLVYFHQGEIVFAASTFPEDDLGEVLFRLGKIDRETLGRVRRRAAPEALGKALVEAGAISPKDLWLGSRYQVEAIIYSLFSLREGSCLFIAKPLDGEPIVRMPMSAQNLIMEGLRRSDETALFRRRIPSPDLVVAAAADFSGSLTPAEERTVALARAAGMTVREAVRRSGLGEFDGLRHLYYLLEKGAVRLEEPPAVPPSGRGAEMLAVFNGALAALCRRLADHNPDFPEELGRLLRELPHPFSYVFRDVLLRPDGTVDGGRIMANLAGLGEEEGDRLLAEALGELLFLAAEQAGRELETGAAADLVRRVREISRRVKNLIGREP